MYTDHGIEGRSKEEDSEEVADEPELCEPPCLYRDQTTVVDHYGENYHHGDGDISLDP